MEDSPANLDEQLRKLKLFIDQSLASGDAFDSRKALQLIQQALDDAISTRTLVCEKEGDVKKARDDLVQYVVDILQAALEDAEFRQPTRERDELCDLDKEITERMKGLLLETKAQLQESLDAKQADEAIQGYVTKFESVQKALTDLQEKVAEGLKKAELSVTEARTEVTKHEGNVTSAAAKVEESCKSLKGLEDKITKGLKDAETSVTEARTEVTKHEGSVTSAAAKVEESCKSLKDLEDKVIDGLKKTAEDVTSAKTQAEACCRELESLRNEITGDPKKRKGASSIKSDVKELQKAVGEVKSLVGTDEVAEQRRLEILENGMGDLLRSLSKAAENSTAVALQTYAEDLRGAVAVWKQAAGDRAKERDALARINTTLANDYDNLAAREDALKQEKEELQEQLSSAQEDMQLREEFIREANQSFQKINDQQDEIKVLKDQCDLMRPGFEASSCFSKTFENLSKHLTNEVSRRENVEETLGNTRTALDASNSQLQAAQSELKKEQFRLEEARKGKSNLAAELKGVKEDLTEERKARESLETELKVVKGDLAEERKAREVLEAGLKTAKTNLETEKGALADEKKARESLEAELKGVKEDLAEERKAREVLEADLKTAKTNLETEKGALADEKKTRESLEAELRIAKAALKGETAILQITQDLKNEVLQKLSGHLPFYINSRKRLRTTSPSKQGSEEGDSSLVVHETMRLTEAMEDTTLEDGQTEKTVLDFNELVSVLCRNLEKLEVIKDESVSTMGSRAILADITPMLTKGSVTPKLDAFLDYSEVGSIYCFTPGVKTAADGEQPLPLQGRSCPAHQGRCTLVLCQTSVDRQAKGYVFMEEDHESSQGSDDTDSGDESSESNR
ncbi:hypothetical protein K4K54_010538 [Colletotrichum sp. SAR 10_86]|nr:hypothetical protein KHU50_010093 [Colletotrichum sp. SAR 10_65]KAI8173086.1 hypothetical protein K4K51_010334 [Colletotrichum sp. SAR 10_75]KAI8218362.1 hypothetical protein K4K54_010538 [Colletotrichum sp. SAR 10_86]